jgi:deoxyribonuclease NucA/NucB
VRRFRSLSLLSLLLALGLTSTAAQPAVAGNPTPIPSQPDRGQPKSLAEADRPRPYEDFTNWTDEDCHKEGSLGETTNSSTGGRVVNHFQFCAWKQHGVTFWAPNQIYPLGTLMFRMTMMAQASEDGRTVTVTFKADEIHVPPRRGVLADIAVISMTPSCSTDKLPAACSITPATRQSIGLRDLGSIGLTFTMQSPRMPTSTNPISRDTGRFRFPYYFTTTTGGQQVDQQIGGIQEFGTSWRCDSAQLTRGEFKKEACVFPTLPHLRFNINDAGITQSSQHIRQAQENPNSTDPVPPENGTKTIATNLHRHWDDALKDAQRNASRKACEAAVPIKPPDTDCDEYPFASTKEGSLAPPLPNYNFSVKYIDYRDNRRSGCWMGKWLVKDRVLEGDEFQVDIFDGPTYPEPPEEPECVEGED